MNVFDLSAKIALDINGYLSGMQTAQAVAISTASVIGSQVSGFIQNSIEVGKSFGTSMSQVAATMGNSMEEMGQEVGSVDTQFGHFEGTLRDFAQFEGKNTAFSAAQCSQALNYMALAGYDTQKSMETLPNVLNLAAAGSMDLAKASDMVTDAQTALGLSQERTTQMMNEMAKAASSGNTSVEQLGDAFLTVGGLARELHGGFINLSDGTKTQVDGTTELTVALTAMANAGIKGSEAGTHMRNILLKLSSPTKEGTERLKDLGVSIFDAGGNMRSLKDIMTDLSTALGSISQEEKLNAISDIFNSRDIASAEALMSAAVNDWDSLGEKILDADGAMEQMAETQLDNLQGDLTKMNSAMEGLQIAISDAATPAMRELTQFSTEMIGKITDVFKDLPEPVQTAIAMIGMVGGKVAEMAPMISGFANSMNLAKIAANTAEDAAKSIGEGAESAAGGISFLGPALAGVGAGVAIAIAAIQKMTAKIDEATKEYKEFKANADAISEAATEAYDGTMAMADGMLTSEDAASKAAQATENLNKLRESQKQSADELANAEKNLKDKLADNKVEMDAADTFFDAMSMGAYSLSTEIGITAEKLQDYIGGTQELEEANQKATAAMRLAENEAAAYNLLATDMTDTERGATEALLNHVSLQENSTEAYGSLIDAVTQLNAAHYEAYMKSAEVKANAEEEIAALQELFEETKEAVAGSLESEFGMFETVEVKVERSVGDMINSLQSQIDYMNNYQQNMAWLTSKGVDEGLVAKLADGSVESAEILQAIVNDGGEHLQEFSEKFKLVEEGKETFTNTMADLTIGYSEKMQELVEISENAAAEMNQYDRAYQAAVNTIWGAVTGVNNTGRGLISVYHNLAQQAINEFYAVWKEASPSKAFESAAENSILGAIIGAENEGENMVDTYRSIGSDALKAYEDEISGDVISPELATAGWIAESPDRIASTIPGGQSQDQTNVTLVLDEQVIGRVLLPYIQQEAARIGVSVAGGY